MAAEASDGSMERIITTLNEMEPIITTANESALPPPGKVGIWDQIRRHIDPVSKVASALSSMLLTAWGVSLLIGGGFFLRYYGSIGFMPEVDVDTSVTLLVGSAMTGIATLLALGVTLLMPAWLWGEMIRKSPALKECWSTCDGKVLPERVIAWLSWPACVVLGGAMVGYLFNVYVGGGGWSVLGGWLGGLLVGAGIVQWRLPKKLARHPDHKQRRDATAYFWGKIVSDALIFPTITVLVVLPFIRATYPDRPDTFVIAGVLPFLIVFLDAATALEWSGITPRRPLGIIAP